VITRSIRLAFCFAALWTLAAAFPSFAQTLGRISGSVTDPSGAAVPGAKVAIRDTDTQAIREVTTDEKGFFVAENLPIGPYAVAVDHAGFKRSEQTGYVLDADGRVTADFQLQMGDASQTVEVVATAAAALNTVSGEISHVIDSEQVDNLALNGRAYAELLTLVPARW